MGWKDWSYWLRGGIIGALISLIITLFMASARLINSTSLDSFPFWVIFGGYFLRISPFIIPAGIIVGVIFGKIIGSKSEIAYGRPTKLKVFLSIIFFLITPAMIVLIPIPLIYGIVGFPLIVSKGLIFQFLIQLLLGLFFSYSISHLISIKYYRDKKLYTQLKAVSYLVLRLILFLILYFLVMSVTAGILRLSIGF